MFCVLQDCRYTLTVRIGEYYLAFSTKIRIYLVLSNCHTKESSICFPLFRKDHLNMLFYTIVDRFVTFTYSILQYAYLFTILSYWNSVAALSFFTATTPSPFHYSIKYRATPQRRHHAPYPLSNLCPQLQF